MEITKLTIDEIPNLDALIDVSDNGTAFCYSYFLKLKKIKWLLKIEKDNELLCLFPLFESGSKVEQSTMYVPYGGPVLFLNRYSYRRSLLLQREIIYELVKYLQKNYDEICFSCDTSMIDVKSFVNLNVVPEVRYTYKIDLTKTLEEIVKDFSKDRKKDLRKAQRFKLELLIDENLELFDINQALIWEMKYGNDSSKSFVEKYLKESIKHDKGKVFIAKYDNKIVGGVAIVWDHDSAYIMYSYYNHALDVSTIPFLYNSIINYLKNETNCRYLDFEGSVFEEIEKWNLSFGAKQYLYFNYYWQKNNREEIYKDLYDYGEK